MKTLMKTYSLLWNYIIVSAKQLNSESFKESVLVFGSLVSHFSTDKNHNPDSFFNFILNLDKIV